MGFQDALYKQHIAYASRAGGGRSPTAPWKPSATYAIEASSELAEERGAYSSYEGSLWSQGVFCPSTPWKRLPGRAAWRRTIHRGQHRSQTLDWDTLRERVKMHGMRNSNVMAIAPTATIANITGVSQSIEPTYQNLYVKSNLSGEFTVVNPYLVQRPEGHRPVGSGHGQRPEVLRWQRAGHRSRSCRPQTRSTPPRSRWSRAGWWMRPAGARSGSTRRSH